MVSWVVSVDSFSDVVSPPPVRMACAVLGYFPFSQSSFADLMGFGYVFFGFGRVGWVVVVFFRAFSLFFCFVMLFMSRF